MPRPVKIDLNCIPVTRDYDVTLVPLPRALWMPAGKCHCEHCQGRHSYFDTLMVPIKGETCLAHYPELQPKQGSMLGHSRRAYHHDAEPHKIINR